MKDKNYVIEYKITITNTGSKDLTNVVVDEKLDGINLDAEQLQVGNLKAGETVEILATYTVTYEADIKKEEGKTILNEVYVSGETVPETDEEPEKVEDEDKTETPVEDAPSVKTEKTANFKQILKQVYEALAKSDKGYDPISQIVGYILSGDPTYITSYNDARNLIRQLDRDELLETLVRNYIGLEE